MLFFCLQTCNLIICHGVDLLHMCTKFHIHELPLDCYLISDTQICVKSPVAL